jgi:molybdopterin-guanine dinucleotide biosynthesis adapter protein
MPITIRRMKVFGIAGFSGSGKTMLIEQLVARCAARGLEVAVLKHSHHGFDVDKPGKDTWRHREAGAHEVMVVSPARWALMHENREGREATLDELLARVSPCDLVLVEGFKQAPIPKLEVYRPDNGKPPLFPDNPYVVGVATDHPGRLETPLPVLDLNDAEAIAAFVLAHLQIENRQPPEGRA